MKYPSQQVCRVVCRWAVTPPLSRAILGDCSYTIGDKLFQSFVTVKPMEYNLAVTPHNYELSQSGTG